MDLVRVGNDYGDPGFVSEKEYLNALLTQQRQLLFVVGDMTCCDTVFAAVDLHDEASDNSHAEASTSSLPMPLTSHLPKSQAPPLLPLVVRTSG